MEYCAHHVRSISLSSSTHPTISKVDEELRKLRNTSIHLSQPVASSHMIRDQLKCLADVYSSLNNLSCFRHSLFLPNLIKWVEEELDVSLVLLETCSGLRDLLTTMKELVRDLHQELRRRRKPTITRQAHDYFHALEKTQKEMKKCLRLSKQVNGCDSFYSDEVISVPQCARVFTEARDLTMLLLQHILSFCMLKSKVKASKLLVLSKAMHNRKVACNMVEEEQTESASFEALFELISSKDIHDDKLFKAQRQMERMELIVSGLESGLEYLLRRLIQNRVCLLNIISHQ